MGIPYTGPLARSTDRSTSKAAAAEGRSARADTHRLRLLREYGKNPISGLTAYEAAAYAGLLDVGYWKRVSELFAEHLLDPNGDERRAPSGKMQTVLVITEQGRRVLEES